MAETLGINRQPFLQLVGRKAVVVAGDIRAGECVDALTTHLVQNHIHLIRDGVLGGFIAQFVDF